MIGRGLFVLTILSNCVLSLPVTSSQLENEDVQVMKCIVEALADVLSRPHPMPVSQECLVTLKTDDRLVSILRHHNFLKELQEIAVQGGQERAQLQRDAGAPESTTQTPQTADDVVADRSMLEALGGPGERSILSPKRRTGNGDGEEEKHVSLGDRESQEDSDIVEEVQVKREDDESPGSHVSESADEWSEGKAEKREEEEEEYGEKRGNSAEGNMIKDKKGAGSEPRNKSKAKKFDKEDEGGKDKRSPFFSHGLKQKGNKMDEMDEEEEEEEDEGELKRESREGLQRWTKRGKALPIKKKAAQRLNSQHEVPHHSKEDTEEEEEKRKRSMQRSPEEKELQMIARRGPEEEGSGSRKSEEPEIESLAAIESELENVAQKLHEMRRG